MPVWCLGLLVTASVLNLAAQQVLINRERRWTAQWSHVQAQALSQSGLLRTLAHLEDARDIDTRCRPQRTHPDPSAANGTGSQSFAARLAHDGARMRCRVDLSGPAGPAAWDCHCSNDGPGAPPSRDPGSGWLTVEFTAEASGLRLWSLAEVPFAGNRRAAARESVSLRRDREGIWRPVVGSWDDAQ